MWKSVRSVEMLSNPWLRVRRDACLLPTGVTLEDYYVVEENDTGSVVALTPERELVMVEQYQHGIGQMCLEIPGGYFDTPAQLSAQQASEQAWREFREETGYDSAAFEYVGRIMHQPTRLNSRAFIFTALDVYPVSGQQLDVTENITVHLIPLDEVMDLLRGGMIGSAISVAGIYMALDQLRRRFPALMVESNG